jgi:hypothetical protein
MVRSNRGLETGWEERDWERDVISGELNCPLSGGKALEEKYGEDVAETLESSRVI